MSKPRVLILGGTGFIGRNLVKFLVDNGLASKIRVADKVMPQMAYLSSIHKKTFENEIVEFKQANLINDAAVAKAFADDSGPYQIVINLAAETKFGGTAEQYEHGTIELGVKCAQAAVANKADRFIQLSTAQVYDPHKKPAKEDSKVKPWTHLAGASLELENRLKGVAGLNWSILRPSIVYGPCDSQGLFPRIICASVYTRLNEKYKVLYDGDLKMNTVHVADVCAAIWHCATVAPPSSVFNLSDKGDTDQEKFNVWMQKLFNVKTGFYGSMMSGLAKMDLKYTAGVANDKHLEPWSAMCKEGNISSPLSPYVDQELLKGEHLSVDGSAIEKTGFTYSFPQCGPDLLREVVEGYIVQGLFPKGVMP